MKSSLNRLWMGNECWKLAYFNLIHWVYKRIIRQIFDFFCYNCHLGFFFNSEKVWKDNVVVCPRDPFPFGIGNGFVDQLFEIPRFTTPLTLNHFTYTTFVAVVVNE